MAAGDVLVATPFMLGQMRGHASGGFPVDFDTDTIKLMLLTAAFDGAKTGHSFVGSLTSMQVTAGTAYTAGGPTVTSITVSFSGTIISIFGGNITIASDAAGFAAARWGVLYKEKNSASLTDSPVVAVVDLGSARTNVTGAVTINFTTGEMIRVSSNP